MAVTTEQQGAAPRDGAPLGDGASFALVFIALMIVYLVWGSTYLGIAIVVEEAPPMASMGLRYTVAGVALGIALSLRGGLARLRLTGRQSLGVGFLSLMLPVLGNGMVAVAEDLGAPSGITGLLIAVAPLMIVLFRLVERDRPRPLTLFGVLLGFVGLAVLMLQGSETAGFPLGPALLVLFASTCWALGSYLQPRVWLPGSVFVTAAYQMFLGGLILIALGLATGERFTGDYSARTWSALGYLIVFGSMVSFTAYVWLLANAPISLVATFAYVNPVVAVVLGWWVLSETITSAVLVGGGIVLVAVALVIAAERPRQPDRRVAATTSAVAGQGEAR